MVQLRLGDTGEGFGILDDGKDAVVHDIWCDVPSSFPPARGRNASAKLPRRRNLRAFVRWFEDAQHRFLVPMRIGKEYKRWIEIEIPGFGGCISASVSPIGIEVEVMWEGESVDELWCDGEVALRYGPHGYYCGLCLPEYVQHYPTREAFWIDHCFDVFLAKVNDVLLHTEILRINISGGASWATPLAADGRDARWRAVEKTTGNQEE